MIMKQCLLVLLAMFIVMGCVGVVSANTELNSTSPTIVITGIELPVIGGDPVTTASTDVTGISSSVTVSWSPAVSSEFAGETVYTATITVDADENYVFNMTALPSVTIEGLTDPTPSITATTDTLTITLIFAVTDSEQTPISSITFSGITTPEANTAPISDDPTIDESYPSESVTVDPSTVTWKTGSTTVSGNFTYDTIYKAEFTISAAEDYILTSDTDVTVDGRTSTIEPTDDGSSATITVTYPQTDSAPTTYTNITSLTITGLTEPVFDEDPDTSVSVSRGGTPLTVSWDPDDSTFEDETVYTATITLQNASGYVFTTIPTVSLNGDTMSSSNLSLNSAKTQLTITYTFPKTAAKVNPGASLSSNVTSGTVPLTVKFYYTLSSFDNCTLTYGDGYSSTLTSSSGNITHTYTTAGSYTASLTAKNVNGTTFSNQSITVNKVGLDASFTASSESGTMPLTVLFVDKSAGSPTQWVWDFGGLGSSATKNPSFTFTTAGTYIVKLTVIDSTGATDSYSRAIYVNTPVTTSTTTPTPTPTNASLTTLSIGEIVIPAPLDIIKEFMHLFYSLYCCEII